MMDSAQDTTKEEKPVEEFDEDGLKIITLPIIGYKMKEKTYLILLETVGVLLAIISIATAIIAFNQIKSASNDVSSIVATWELLPVADVVWKDSLADGGSPCPPDYNMVPPMKTVAGGDYCACADGAEYYLLIPSPKTGATKPAVSGPGACLRNQTSGFMKAAYKCLTVTNTLPSVTLPSWTGQVQCYKRGFTNAMNTKSAEKGACPSGTHQCGSTALPVCINDATSGCPINWEADSDAIAGYGITNAATLTTESLGAAPVPFSYAGTSTLVNPAQNGNHYVQKGKTFVSGIWTPLPVVEIGNSMGTPCYGEEQAVDGTQSQLGDTTISGNINIASPKTCSQKTDIRFMATKNYKIGQLVYENAFARGITSCNANTDNTDFFAGSTKCVVGGAGPTGCVAGIEDPAPLSTGEGSFRTACKSAANCCKAGDGLCEYAAYQSKCGQWQNIATKNQQTVSFYQKAQIFWSDTCPYTKEDVVKSNGPLQKAINIQQTLLILNCIVNVVLIILGSYIAYLCYKKFNEPTTFYAELEEKWKPRAVTFGTLIKLPVIIATIAVTKAITNFFVTLGKENCAGSGAMGAVTNETFTYLAKVLPKVVSANSATLAMDLLGFLPAVYAYLAPYLCPGKEKTAADEREDFDSVDPAPEPSKKVGGGADLRDLGGL